MALQLRTTLPDGVPGPAYQREIARLLDNTAHDILSGVPPEKYQGAVARYQVLLEMLMFAEQEVEKMNNPQGEAIADE
jgi:hypothetical protein